MASGEAFRFFDLIPELRNHIYDLLFENHVVDCESSRYEVPGILLVSKQTFAEAHGAYYRQSEFRSVSSAAAEKRLSILNPSYTPLVEHINVDMVSRVSDLYGHDQSIYVRSQSKDEELFETAYLAQCAVLWLRMGLQEQNCGHFIPGSIKASIRLGKERTLFTATPFETFRDAVAERSTGYLHSESNEKLIAMVRHQACYFNFDHVNPRKCWHRLWSSELPSPPYKCKCPRKLEAKR